MSKPGIDPIDLAQEQQLSVHHEAEEAMQAYFVCELRELPGDAVSSSPKCMGTVSCCCY